jgi:hypothetical protein
MNGREIRGYSKSDPLLDPNNKTIIHKIFTDISVKLFEGRTLLMLRSLISNTILSALNIAIGPELITVWSLGFPQCAL